jgi:hypothetical protein
MVLEESSSRSSKRRRSGENETGHALSEDIPWCPATPAADFFLEGHEHANSIMSPSFTMSPMQSFRHEESLIAANNAKERYRRSLESEMQRSKDLAARLAVTEERAKCEINELKLEHKRKEQALEEKLKGMDGLLQSAKEAHPQSTGICTIMCYIKAWNRRF